MAVLPKQPGGGRAGPPGKKDLQPQSVTVVVPSPTGVRDGTDVKVNGQLRLQTGSPGPLPPGWTSFSVSHAGRTWFAERDLKLQPQKAPPVVIDLAPVVRNAAAIRGAGAGTSRSGNAATVVYVHGIGNKPPADVLRCQWDRALFDVQLGDRSRLAYWVDRALYPTPEAGTCQGADMSLPGAAGMAARAASLAAPSDPRSELIEALARSDEERDGLAAIATRLAEAADRVPGGQAAGQPAARILPGGKLTRRWLARWLTDLFLPDVHAYLFDAEERERMRDALRDRLRGGGEPFVVIGHSLGSVVAYDLLRSFAPGECDVALLVTLGSPLGMREIRDHLAAEGKLATPECVRHWADFADEADLVSIGDLVQDMDGLENYYGPNASGGAAVRTSWIRNLDRATNPHSGTGFLRTEEVRTAVRRVTGQAFASPLARSAIASDLAAKAELGGGGTLHEVLIQLEDADGEAGPESLRAIASRLEAALLSMAQGRPSRIERIEEDPPEQLRRFVAARLTRSEIEALRTLAPQLGVRLVWANAAKRALIATSAATVQALPAQLGYGATGRGIGWAVLDTGIDEEHPHFGLHGNVREQWDCLTRKVERLTGGKDADPNGHGTHVAGIIAGETRWNLDGREQRMAGMAPETALYGFRVLREDGVGSDAAIIRALDKVASINEGASRLVIHGVNLSLGSAYDPGVYGCGHTPLCQELRRLWRQGVIVCLAAGNEGYATFQSGGGDVGLNLDLSIGDPANLEEAIAVGSVHKRNPHTYGISYFSSRGPTADGRRKPDCVAPGENVCSARTGARRPKGKEPDLTGCFVEMSGTSMATPHVSGLLAGFLSQRREFVGAPDRAKAILLANCTDLKRDPNMQGAGLVNLTRMLLAT